MRIGRFTFSEAELEKFLETVSVVQAVPEPVAPQEDPMRHYHLLRHASKEVGVKELVNGSNPRVEEYHRYATVDNDKGVDDSVPWCSSFICWSCETSPVPMSSTNSRLARSWLDWGVSTVNNPICGDIVVYWRGSKDGWQGHVGIYLTHTSNGFIYTLGGNQSDAVSIAAYSTNQLLDTRRSRYAPLKYSEKQLAELVKLRESIMGA